MAIDAQRLLACEVVDARQSYTARDSALYALSVGMGQDPLDERLAFVDPNRGEAQRVVPSMALVLGCPALLLVPPDARVELTCSLDAQAIEWQRPLPPNGEVIGRTRVLRLVDGGQGGDGMVVLERRLVDPATQQLYATMTQTHMVRAKRAFGGDPGPRPPPHTLPADPPPWRIDVRSRPEQALLYRLNGDLDPLDAKPGSVPQSGCSRPMQAMCVVGMATQALMRVLADDDPTRLRAMEMRFAAPLFVGETLRLEAWAEGSFRARSLERGRIVLDNGRMTCALPPLRRRS